jgi:hypothetical protein
LTADSPPTALKATLAQDWSETEGLATEHLIDEEMVVALCVGAGCDYLVSSREVNIVDTTSIVLLIQYYT